MKFIITVFLLAGISYGEVEKKDEQEHIEDQIKKEEKYAQEQRFYMGDEYDLKAAEVDERSLENIPDQPEYNDDFNMDHVYD